ncbi:MAG TPA: hypothetical protein VEZ90_19730 [Blastocatellia bacterium]|nr:hypothetical protein [Blastocatellia bacterium]
MVTRWRTRVVHFRLDEWDALSGRNELEAITLAQTNSVTNNQIQSVTSGGSPVTYTYDASGNITSDGAHTYQWDAENRLTQVDSASTTSTETTRHGSSHHDYTSSKQEKGLRYYNELRATNSCDTECDIGPILTSPVGQDPLCFQWLHVAIPWVGAVCRRPNTTYTFSEEQSDIGDCVETSSN